MVGYCQKNCQVTVNQLFAAVSLLSGKVYLSFGIIKNWPTASNLSVNSFWESCS